MNCNLFFFLLCLAATSVQSCQRSDPDTARDIANIRAAYQALNDRNFDAFAALCDGENYMEVNVAPTPIKGVEPSIALYKQFTDGFPDFKLEVTDIAPAGNGRYLLRTNITGTHTGTFMGIPPTGKPIQWTDADVVVVNADGKCISHEITRQGEALVQIGHAAMLNPNTPLVLQAYETLGKGDIPGLLETIDDKAVFEIEENEFDGQARRYEGKEGAAKFFQELGSKFKYTKFQPIQIMADGDDVMVHIYTEYTYVPSGKNYSNDIVHHFKVVNGKMTYAKGFDGIARLK